MTWEGKGEACWECLVKNANIKIKNPKFYILHSKYSNAFRYESELNVNEIKDIPSSASGSTDTFLHKESFQCPDLSAWMNDGTDKDHIKKASEVPLRFFVTF